MQHFLLKCGKFSSFLNFKLTSWLQTQQLREINLKKKGLKNYSDIDDREVCSSEFMVFKYGIN